MRFHCAEHVRVSLSFTCMERHFVVTSLVLWEIYPKLFRTFGGGGAFVFIWKRQIPNHSRVCIYYNFFLFPFVFFFYRMDGINLSSGSIRVNGRAFSRRIGAQWILRKWGGVEHVDSKKKKKEKKKTESCLFLLLLFESNWLQKGDAFACCQEKFVDRVAITCTTHTVNSSFSKCNACLVSILQSKGQINLFQVLSHNWIFFFSRGVVVYSARNWRNFYWFLFLFFVYWFFFFFVLLNFVVVCTTGSGLQAGTNGRLGYYADYLFDRPGYPLLGRPNGGRLLLPPPTSQAAPLASRQSRGGGDYFARSQEPAAILCHGQPCVVIFRIHPQTQKSRWYWIPLAPHPHTFRRVSRLSTAIYLSFPSSIPIPSHFLWVCDTNAIFVRHVAPSIIRILHIRKNEFGCTRAVDRRRLGLFFVLCSWFIYEI